MRGSGRLSASSPRGCSCTGRPTRCWSRFTARCSSDCRSSCGTTPRSRAGLRPRGRRRRASRSASCTSAPGSTPSTWAAGCYGSRGFLPYYIAQGCDILFFCAALWLLSSRDGRRHTQNAMWLIIPLIGIYPVSYYGQFGPWTGTGASIAPIQFPWGTLIAVGIGIIAYYWGVASGFNTDELRELTEAAVPAPASPADSGPTVIGPATGEAPSPA